MTENPNNSAWKRRLAADVEIQLRVLGARLSHARRARGLTASGLASRMGVDRRTLASLERGNAAVSLGVFLQALAVLDLLSGVDAVVDPENDPAGIAAAIRRARKGRSPLPKISDEEVDF